MRSPGGEADKGLGGWNRPLLSRQDGWIKSPRASERGADLSSRQRPEARFGRSQGASGSFLFFTLILFPISFVSRLVRISWLSSSS
jgi:hypothetical protein